MCEAVKAAHFRLELEEEEATLPSGNSLLWVFLYSPGETCQSQSQTAWELKVGPTRAGSNRACLEPAQPRSLGHRRLLGLPSLGFLTLRQEVVSGGLDAPPRLLPLN